jgi:hypothetical protein
MKRIAALTLLAVLGAAYPALAQAPNSGSTKSDRQAAKLAQQKQTALYKYQKKQEKAQAKAQRKADKQQQKAARKYEKEQRTLLKNQKLPATHAS